MKRKNRLLLLLKVQLMSYFGINKALRSGNSKDKNRLMGRAALSVLLVGYFAWFSYFYSNGIAQTMLATGGEMAAVPAIIYAAASLFMLITGIYSGGKTLFAYKDYDQVMSMPVSVAAVAASRIILMYTYQLLFTVILILPAGIVYSMYVQVGPAFWAVYLVCMLLTPCIPLIISAALGTVITALSSRFGRMGTAVNIVLSMVFVLAVVFAPGLLPGNGTDMSVLISGVVGTVQSSWPLARMFVRAVCELDGLSIVAFCALSVGFMAAFSLLIAVRYRQLCSRVASAGGTVKRGRADVREAPPLKALYVREVKRYFSSSIYVMNTIIGLVLAVVACAALLAAGGVSSLAGGEYAVLGDILAPIAPLVVSAMVCMSTTTGSAISLEGEQLWIIKSMPISVKKIFLAKVLVNLSLTIPAAAVCAVLLALALGTNAVQSILLFIIPAVYAVFSALFGLFINLRIPKLNWTNEAQVVKQSMASMISMLGTMLLVIVIAGVCMASPKPEVLASVTTLAPLLAAVIICIYLDKNGERVFKQLG